MNITPRKAMVADIRKPRLYQTKVSLCDAMLKIGRKTFARADCRISFEDGSTEDVGRFWVDAGDDHSYQITYKKGMKL